MDIQAFIDQWFVQPFWERGGYNIVNTVVYAAIALVAIFAIWRLLGWLKIKVNRKFILAIVPYILFGSTVRVLVDANRYPYSPLTVTPGIYIVTFAVVLAPLILLRKRPDYERDLGLFGLAAWLSQIWMVPFPVNWLPALQVLALAVLGVAVALLAIRLLRLADSLPYRLAAFAHAFDGGSTAIAVSQLGYWEQHVVGGALVTLNPFLFYAVKVAFITAAIVVLQKAKLSEQERNYLTLILIIFGLAPGFRDWLRLLAGV